MIEQESQNLTPEFEWQRVPIGAPIKAAVRRYMPMDVVVERWAEAQRQRLPRLIEGACESPIEELFLGAWLSLVPSVEVRSPEKLKKQGLPCCRAFLDPSDGSHLLTQAERIVSGRAMRLDFALVRDDVKVTVECDGHDWHERSKEQAASDKSRDRLLLADGWSVLRFTGSEIHADPIKCAEEAITILRGVAPKPVVVAKTARRGPRRRPELEPFCAPPRPKLTPEEEAKQLAESSEAAKAILAMLEGLGTK